MAAVDRSAFLAGPCAVLGRVALASLLVIAAPVQAQEPPPKAGREAAGDALRGARLFTNTRGESGRPVGNCVACHANQQALREMLANRGARPDDARAVARLLQRALDGAQPGAANAKAQYRGVLGPRDLRDLAAYLAQAART